MRIESLTFLRFFAAFVVVVFHYGRSSTLAKATHPLMECGSEMVTFFFVLSGFVLMLAYMQRRVSSVRQFLIARIARLMPIYWVAMWLSISWAPVQWDLPRSVWLPNLLFAQAWIPRIAIKVNFPAWSLSVEVFFYLLFPWLLIALQKRKPSARVLLWLSALVWLLTEVLLTALRNNSSFDPGNTEHLALYRYFPVGHLCSFLLGVAGGYAFTTRQGKPQESGARSLALCSLGIALFFASTQFRDSLQHFGSWQLPYDVSLYAPIFLFLIWSLARSNNGLTRFLSLRPLVFLGEISYSFYILQNPINLLYKNNIEQYLHLEEEQHFYAFLLLLSMASALSFYVIEKPARLLLLWCARQIPGLLPAKAEQAEIR